MHWGANVGIARNSGRAATTLCLTVIDVKVLSWLTKAKNIDKQSKHHPHHQHISASHHVLYLIVLAIEFTATRRFRDTLATAQNIARIANATFRTRAGAGRRFSRTGLRTGVCAGLVVAVRIARDRWGLTGEWAQWHQNHLLACSVVPLLVLGRLNFGSLVASPFLGSTGVSSNRLQATYDRNFHSSRVPR